MSTLLIAVVLAKLVYSDDSDYACGSFIHSEGKNFR